MEKNTTEKPNKFGSYFFGDFENNEKELIRLKKQASIGLKIEQEIWKKIDVKEQGNILDIGCGPGVISGALADFYKHSHVTGIDKNELLIQDALNGIQKEHENLTFKTGDIHELNEGAFDFIYSRFLFQHLKNPLDAIKNLYNNLNDDGKVCIVDVDDAWLSLMPKSNDFEAYIAKSQEYQAKYGGDRFVGSKLHQHFIDAGFKEVHTEVKMVSTEHIRIDHFLDMIINYKFLLFKDAEAAEKEELNALRENILNYTNIRNSWGAIGIFFVTATK